MSTRKEAPGTLDPVEFYFAPKPLMVVMGDGLVGFKRVGGIDGGTLVPDLALTLPTPTDEGKTYVFQLRPGIRYSNGEIVVASDFLRGIERGFRIQGLLTPAFDYFGSLVGGRECKETPKSCDLSEGIVSDDQAGTVTFHLEKPNPDFLSNLALSNAFPVPSSTPIDEQQIRAGVPGTGPYMLEGRMTKHGLVLVRNEYFDQWSAEAQPDGNVDRTEWTFGGTPDELADVVANGDADYMVEDSPPSRIEDLRVSFASQVYEHPLLWLYYISLNTKLPPFDHKDVRRALNLAVDRQRIVDFNGGSAVATLTCQILPPNFPGYEPYCPYTIDPKPGEAVWTGPDMDEAQRLVRRSGTAGTHVTYWYSPDFLGSPKAQAEYFVQVLKELGFVADLRSTGTVDEHFAALTDPSRGVQIAPAGWSADYPSASSFIGTLVGCDLFPDPNYGGFCDRDIDRMIEHSVKVSTEDPAASGQAWAEVDRAITDQAPFVSQTNPIRVDLVSKRLENYQYNPVWGPCSPMFGCVDLAITRTRWCS